MTKKKIQFTIVLLLFLIVSYLHPIINLDISSRDGPKSYYISDSAGPSFDLTLMPDNADLIPGSESCAMTLELRVGVTDEDGVHTVIGSYKNKSEPIWTNVTMHLDYSTENSDDYIAEALQYTVPGGEFLVIWQIQFYANDILGNWNVSDYKEHSVYRPNLPSPTTYKFVRPVEVLVLGVMGIFGILVIILISRHVFYRKGR